MISSSNTVTVPNLVLLPKIAQFIIFAGLKGEFVKRGVGRFSQAKEPWSGKRYVVVQFHPLYNFVFSLVCSYVWLYKIRNIKQRKIPNGNEDKSEPQQIFLEPHFVLNFMIVTKTEHQSRQEAYDQQKRGCSFQDNVYNVYIILFISLPLNKVFD